MANSKTVYLSNAVLDHVLGKGARNMTSPASLYIGLGTGVTDVLTGEITSAGGYARQTISFAAASAGNAASSDAQTFGPATDDWANVTHFGIFDALTSGNCLYADALSAAKDAGIDDTIELGIGDVDVTES